MCGSTCPCSRCEGSRLPIADRLRQATVVDPSGCHLFTGNINQFGYGRFQHRHVSYWAHRVALALKLGYSDGVLPVEITARHTCDNPPCVNPDHLLPGTQADNMADAKARGRAKGPKSWVLDADGVPRCQRGHDMTDPNNLRPCGERCRTCRSVAGKKDEVIR